MSFEWEEYLELAKELSGVAGTRASAEAKNRSAISRAYYAAFGTACAYCKKVPGVDLSGGVEDHQIVRAYFVGSRGNKERIGVGARLDQLRKDRNKADYTDEIIGCLKLRNRCLNQSTHVIDAIRKFSIPEL